MGLESGTYISDLNPSNPITAQDVVREGSDHLRLIKSTILNTFPNITGALTLSHSQLNQAALKNVANVFTQQQTIQAADASLKLAETDAAADEGDWLLRAQGGFLTLQAIDDAGTTIGQALAFARSGLSIASASLYVGSDDLAVSAQAGAETALFFDGGLRLNTSGSGMRVFGGASPGIGAAQNTNMTLRQLDNEIVANIGFFNSDKMIIKSANHGGTVSLQGEDTGGATRELVQGDPDGSVSLYQAGALRLLTAADGLRMRSSSNSLVYLQIDGVTGGIRGLVGYVSSGELRLENRVNGAAVGLRAYDSGGINRQVFSGNPDAAASLFFAGQQKLATASNGVAITGDLAATGDLSGTDVVAGGDVSGVNLAASGNVTGVNVTASSQVQAASMKGAVTGVGIAASEGRFEVVSALPGTPDANTIYFVV